MPLAESTRQSTLPVGVSDVLLLSTYSGGIVKVLLRRATRLREFSEARLFRPPMMARSTTTVGGKRERFFAETTTADM